MSDGDVPGSRVPEMSIRSPVRRQGRTDIYLISKVTQNFSTIPERKKSYFWEKVNKNSASSLWLGFFATQSLDKYEFHDDRPRFRKRSLTA